jgi:uncharacterized glyoxalase superfamily protein PhnB
VLTGLAPVLLVTDVHVWVEDVDAFHEELVGRGADVILAPTDQGYGQREIRVRDPFGYILAFGKPLGWLGITATRIGS